MSEGLGEISTCNEGGLTLITHRVKINQEMNNFTKKPQIRIKKGLFYKIILR